MGSQGSLGPTFGEKVGAVGIKSPGRLLPHPPGRCRPEVAGEVAWHCSSRASVSGGVEAASGV